MKQSQIICVRNLLYRRKMTISELAKEIETSRVSVSMALNGRLQSQLVDDRILNWYKSKKEEK